MKQFRSLTMMFIAGLFAVISALGLSACGHKEEPPRPPTVEEQRAANLARSTENAKTQALLEQQRSTALENIKANVANYFAVNPRFQPASDWSVIPHTDDYIDPACPQGSGWGWANIMNPKLKTTEGQPTKFKVWCSTSSASLGCYIENDFLTSPHGAKAKRCDADLPHPLKPIK